MLREILTSYTFVIDTERYAGNFERELCGYTTGVIGQCEVGEEDAQEFKKDIPGNNPFEDIIRQVPDEHGCLRPVAIRPTSGWFGNGFGRYFRETDPDAEEKAQKHYEISCLEEAKKRPYASDEYNRREEEGWLNKARQKFTKYPAYLSVAIFFCTLPPNELIKLMKERALKYCSREKIQLTGFRLLQLNIIETPIDISLL